MRDFRAALRARFTKREAPPEKPRRQLTKVRVDYKGERRRVEVRLPAPLVHALNLVASLRSTDRNVLIETMLTDAVAAEQARVGDDAWKELLDRAQSGQGLAHR